MVYSKNFMKDYRLYHVPQMSCFCQVVGYLIACFQHDIIHIVALQSASYNASESITALAVFVLPMFWYLQLNYAAVNLAADYYTLFCNRIMCSHRSHHKEKSVSLTHFYVETIQTTFL